MKIKGMTTLDILAKKTTTIEKKNGSGNYEQTVVVFSQENEVGVLPIPLDIFDSVVVDAKNTFETQYFNGVIDGKGINSFKIIGIVPFRKETASNTEKK